MRTKTRTAFSNSLSLPQDVIALTETWLNPSVYSNEIFPSEFEVFRRDRHCDNIRSLGGGVLIAVRNFLKTEEILIPDTSDIEFVCVRISTSDTRHYIACVYIPPISSSQTYESVVRAIDYIYDLMLPDDNLLVCGDFNLPKLLWSNVLDLESNFYTPSNITSCSESTIIDNLNSCSLQQINGVSNCLGRHLDLVFTSDTANSSVVKAGFNLVPTDPYHPPLSILFLGHPPKEFSSFDFTYSFNFKRANFDLLRHLIAIADFKPMLSMNNIDEATGLFYQIVFDCVAKSVPLMIRRNSSNIPWLSKELRSLRNRRNKAWRKYLLTRSPYDYSSYCSLSSDFRTRSNESYSSYLAKVTHELHLNPKYFWQFVNDRRKSNNYPSVIKLGESSSSDPKIISQMFATHFCESFNNNDFSVDSSYFGFMDTSCTTSLQNLKLIPDDVLKSILGCDNSYSPGPDGIPSVLLKACSDVLISPLLFLFNLSLSSHTFPNVWKLSYIVPIHKKGSRSLVDNYRPVAKLSTISKIFEASVYEYLYFHSKSIISVNQHGFIRNRSTVSNLVEFTSHTSHALESGFTVDCIYTDFSKAFDKLSHKIILFKLQALGFPQAFILWVSSYLSSRCYLVQFNQSFSSPFVVNSGVPQGSHLGPLFFVLAINDVVNIIRNANILIYADDIKLFRTITSPIDRHLLQDDINRFSTWCNKNDLLLNTDKCRVISFSRKRASSDHIYSIQSCYLTRVVRMLDLGVVFDAKLDFVDHIEYIVNRANSSLGFIRRWSHEFNDPYLLKSLYTSFVRSILEYASPVWNPYYSVHQKKSNLFKGDL